MHTTMKSLAIAQRERVASTQHGGPYWVRVSTRVPSHQLIHVLRCIIRDDHLCYLTVMLMTTVVRRKPFGRSFAGWKVAVVCSHGACRPFVKEVVST